MSRVTESADRAETRDVEAAPAGVLSGAARTGLALAGFVIGFFASWCGIGGGLFAVPILHFGRGLALKRAVATGLVLVLATAIAASATELLQPQPSVSLTRVAPLIVGVLLGAPLGFATLQRMPVVLLRRVFVVVLLLASWRILTGASDPSGTEWTPNAQALLLVALVGFGGGFVAPLVGVGGGLLMVPGLYLLVDGFGFEEARAASLVAAVFGASRSLSLHARVGRVQWREGLSLGAGALLGAASGVVVLEHLGAVDAARTLLGVVLALVALRFAADAVRARD